MLERLKRHPFDVVAHFRDVLVLTYAFPAAILRPLLPLGLDLDTFTDAGDEVGFVAIALVRVERMRPAFLPSWLGQRFVLVGFRVFARFQDLTGRTRRGLRILESRTDRRLMAGLGNLLTHYNYKRADISWRREDDVLAVRLSEPRRGVTLEVAADLKAEVPLPDSSPFADWQQARRYAGPLPWTFDYDGARHAIVMIKGERVGWTPRSVAVEVRINRFFERAPFTNHPPKLASVFHLENIDYCWRRGIFSPLGQAVS
jgi:hypothetical protein